MRRVILFSIFSVALALVLGAAVFRISADAKPTAPNNVTAANNADKTAIEVRWRWSYTLPPDSKLARFQINRSKDNVDFSNVVGFWSEGGKRNGEEYVFMDKKDLVKGEAYYYKTVAIISDGKKESVSDFSDPSPGVIFGSNEEPPKPVIGEATLYLDPGLSNLDLKPNEEFEIAVRVSGSDISEVDSFLAYESSADGIFEYIELDDTGSDFEVANGVQGKPSPNQNVITIKRKADATGDGKRSGSDLLVAKVKFKLTRAGTGTVNFSLSEPNKSKVLSGGTDILKTVRGGAYTAPYNKGKTPLPPGDFKADIFACSVDLQWNYKDKADFFRIGRSTKSDFQDKDLISTVFIPWIGDKESYVYTDKGLQYNKAYYYQAVASYGDFDSLEELLEDDGGSAIVVVLKGPAPAPSAPSGLKAFGKDGNKTIDLYWKISPENKPTNFEIWRIASLDSVGKQFPLDKDGNEIYKLIGDYNAGSVLDTDDASGNGYVYSDSDLGEGLNTNFLYKYKVKGYIASSDCGSDGKIYASSDAGPIAVPLMPKFKYADYNYNVDPGKDFIELVWDSYKSEYFGSFKIFRKLGGDYSETPAFSIASKDKISHKDDVVNAGKRFYAMQVCNGNESGCSALSNEVDAIVADSPQNLRITIVSLDEKEAEINVSWDNTFPKIPEVTGRNNYLEEKIGDFSDEKCDVDWNPENVVLAYPSPDKTVFRIPEPPYSKKFPLNEVLTYRVRAKFGEVYTNCSKAKIDLSNLKKFKGWGWANAGKDVDEKTKAETIIGLGWARLSKDTKDGKDGAGAEDTNASSWYGIYADRNNTNSKGSLLYGYAWGGNICPEEDKDRKALIKDGDPGKTACGPGWLSFNRTDLNYKTDMCPFPDSDGNCEARLDFATGKLSGWARFLGASSSITHPDIKPALTAGSWTGWLRLRSEEGDVKYGLCYGGMEPNTDGAECKGDGDSGDPKYENEMINGYAWGDAVIGWMGFGEAGSEGTETTIPDSCKPTLKISPISASVFLGGSQEFRVSVGKPSNDACPTSLEELRIETVKSSDVLNPSVYSGSGLGFKTEPSPYLYTYKTSGTTGAEAVSATLKYKYNSLEGSASAKADVAVSEAGIRFAGYSCVDMEEDVPKLVVNWQDDIATEHTKTLYRADNDSFSGAAILNTKISGSERYSFSDSGIILGKSYYYKLETSDKKALSGKVSCSKSSIEPTGVKVFSYDPRTLFINWKDNDWRAGHSFKVERLKVQPAEPKGVAAKAVSENQVKLDWTNETIWTPYETAVERAKNVDFQPLEKPSFSVSPILPKDDPRRTFFYNDSGLIEGTDYWYRLRACSHVLTDNSRYSTSPLNTNNKVIKPVPVCSATSTEVSVTTSPRAPTGLNSPSQGIDYINLSWADNSSGESGYRIYRNSSKVGGDQGPNKTSYTDSGLSSGVSYAYKVCAYRVAPDGGSVENCIPSPSEPLFTASTENPVVKFDLNVKVSPSSADNSVSVSGCESGNCGSVSSEGNWTFISGATANLTANPGLSYKFLNWGGKCSEEKSASCSFTMDNGYSVVANFEPASHAFLMPNIFRASIFDPVAKLASRGKTELGTGVKSVFQLIAGVIQKGEEILVSVFSPKGEAQIAPDYSAYFDTVKTGLAGSFFRDSGLEPDTVYLYRVKSCVGSTDEGCSVWSNESAGKTLVGGDETTIGAGEKRPVCTRNIYCDFGFKGVLSEGVNFEGKKATEESEYQCRINNDCRGVDSSEQGYGER